MDRFFGNWTDGEWSIPGPRQLLSKVGSREDAATKGRCSSTGETTGDTRNFVARSTRYQNYNEKVTERSELVGIRREMFGPFFITTADGLAKGLGFTVCRNLIHELSRETSAPSETRQATSAIIDSPAGPIANAKGTVQ